MTLTSVNRILGIDPGSRAAGFAVLEYGNTGPFHPRRCQVVDAGVLKLEPRLSIFERIGLLHQAVFDIADKWQPDVCVVESAFYGASAQSSLRLGEARGGVIAAMRRLGVSVAEITPAKVKKTVVGHGRASKDDVSLAVRSLLGFDRAELPHDVSDAVAIALAYGLQVPINQHVALTSRPVSRCE